MLNTICIVLVLGTFKLCMHMCVPIWMLKHTHPPGTVKICELEQNKVCETNIPLAEMK